MSILAVATMGVGAFVLLRGGGDGQNGEDRPPADLTWEVGFTKVVAVQDKPPQRQIDATTQELAALMDELYTTGFVDPTRWDGGAFPTLPGFFADEAAGQATKDLDDLSLGSLAPRIERVDPAKSRLFVSLLVDDEGEITVADVDATFRAAATTRAGAPFKIFHKGRFFLEPLDGTWKIVGYRVTGEINEHAGEDEPQPGPSAEATP